MKCVFFYASTCLALFSSYAYPAAAKEKVEYSDTYKTPRVGGYISPRPQRVVRQIGNIGDKPLMNFSYTDKNGQLLGSFDYTLTETEDVSCNCLSTNKSYYADVIEWYVQPVNKNEFITQAKNYLYKQHGIKNIYNKNGKLL